MSDVRIYTRYDPPPPVILTGFEKTRTRQSEAKATDINEIMARYERTGVLPVSNRQAFFADVSKMGDYREAIEQVRMAEDAFMRVEAKVRERFGNDPAQFLDFVSDPGNRAEMVELGLIEDEMGVPPAPAVEPEIPVPEGPGS